MENVDVLAYLRSQHEMLAHAIMGKTLSLTQAQRVKTIDAMTLVHLRIAELIGAAERITPFASDEQWKRFYAARAAVTAHPNDAEGTPPASTLEG